MRDTHIRGTRIVDAWERGVKVAFIGSHGIRKTTAAHGFAHTLQRAGRSVEYGREVVRDNPFGINETADDKAQLWVLMSQIKMELELARSPEVLVTDRGVMDNYAYYLRACHREDRYGVYELVRTWSGTYDMVVRLRADVSLQQDGVRSTNDSFRVEIEEILDEELPRLVDANKMVDIAASEIDDKFDWTELAERLAGSVGEPLYASGVSRQHRRRRRKPKQLPVGEQLALGGEER